MEEGAENLNVYMNYLIKVHWLCQPNISCSLTLLCRRLAQRRGI